MKYLAAIIIMAGLFTVEAGAVLSTNLDSVIVYPNPVQAKLGQTGATFDYLTPSVKIRIFRVTGELVYERDVVTGTGTAVWPAVNKDGEKVASGVYIYIVTNPAGNKKTGKIAVVR